MNWWDKKEPLPPVTPDYETYYGTKEKCEASVRALLDPQLKTFGPYLREQICKEFVRFVLTDLPHEAHPAEHTFESTERWAQEHFIDRKNQWCKQLPGTLSTLLSRITDNIPPNLRQTAEPEWNNTTRPLYEFMPDLGSVIHNITVTFREARYRHDTSRPIPEYVFSLNLRMLIGNSAELVNKDGATWFEGAKINFPLAYKSKLPPAELVDGYLRSTPFEYLLKTPIPDGVVAPATWEIPQETRYSGTWICAAQGKGKTNLLRVMIANRLKEWDSSIILFDSKGDLADTFRNVDVGRDVYTIDPHPNLALNPLDLGTHNVSTLMYVFSSLLDAKFTPLQTVAFRNTLHLCSLIPGANLAIFRDIIANGPAKYPDALAKLDDEDRSFWENEYDSGTYKDTRQQILWRLNLIRPSGSMMRTMFNAPKTLIDMPRLMGTKSPSLCSLVIINNSRALLDPLQSEFFARLFLGMILGAAEQRATLPDSQKWPCFVYLDEAQTVIAKEENIADLIYRCRSQKIAVVAAHQSLSQLESPKVISALGDCAIRYVNSDYDAPALAPRLQTTTEHILGLKVGQFAMWVRDQHRTAVTTDVPLYDPNTFPKLTTEALAQREAGMRANFHYTPQTASRAATAAIPMDEKWGGKPVI